MNLRLIQWHIYSRKQSKREGCRFSSPWLRLPDEIMKPERGIWIQMSVEAQIVTVALEAKEEQQLEFEMVF
jgi:hypothetical protein